MREQPVEQAGAKPDGSPTSLEKGSTGRPSLAEGDFGVLVDAVSHNIVHRLDEKRRHDRARAMTWMPVATILAVAVASFLVDELLTSRVQQAVAQANVDSSFLARVAALNIRVLRLDLQTGFEEDEAHELIAQLDSIAKLFVENPDISRTQQQEYSEALTFAVETLANNFAAADRSDLVGALERTTPAIAERSDIFTQNMAQNLGRELIGMPGGESAWRDFTGETIETYRRYQVYAKRANETGYPELYLVYELVMRHLGGVPNEEIYELVDDIISLSPGDLEAFQTLMVIHAEESYTTNPDATSSRVARRFRDFLDKYHERNPVLDSVWETVAEQ